MVGLILNEEGYVTYPYNIFKHIESYVRKLNWIITNVECVGRAPFTFLFEDNEESFIDGDYLYEMLEAHSDIQWVWGVLSGFPKELAYESIRKAPIFDISMEQPYLQGKLHHVSPDAVLELIAFDSTESYMLIDDELVAQQIKSKFTHSENLEKYVF